MANRKGSTLMRVVTVILLLAIMGGVYLVFSTLFSRKSTIAEEKIALVSRGEMVRSVVATGKIEPVSRIDIKSKASGIIQYLYVDDGDPVRQGQVLLELDREQLQASLREAQANLQARKAMLEKAESEVKSASLAQEKATLEAESQDLEFARREWDRMKQLYQDSLIAKSQMDVAEQRYRAEQVRDKVLKKDILVRESEFLSAQKARHQAQADFYSTEAALARAEEELRNASIRSPIDGIVLKKFLEVGDAVSSILQLGSNATLIMTIGDIRELYFKGNVDESDIGQIRVGLPVRLTVETFRDKVFPGEVTLIAPMGQEKENVTRFEVRARIGADVSSLRANMSANAEIVLWKEDNVLLIPETAVIYDERKATFVDRCVEREGMLDAVRVPIKAGAGNGSKVVVLEGLTEKDRVVMQ